MKQLLKKIPLARTLARTARRLARTARALRRRAGRALVPGSDNGGSASPAGVTRVRAALRRIPLVRAIARPIRRARRRVRAFRARIAALWAGRTATSGGGGRSGEYSLLRVEWRDQGPTPGLLERAHSLSRNTVAWRIMHPRVWLVFCGALLEAGDEEAAEQLLRTWIARTPDAYDHLALCLPVARFARDLGVRDRRVERAAEIADVLAANRDADIFGAAVRGRTIAVVGNGPGCLGTRSGAEIDGHDIVIRFNNFPAGYEADYGSRTDIWVRGAHPDVVDRFEIEQYALVLWEMDFFRNVVETPAHSGILSRDTRFSPERVTHIDTATKHSLWERSGLLLPTSGAQLLWMLHEKRGSLDGVDVYGFSTLDGSSDLGHYYDSLGDMGSRHDARAEGEFLRELLDESRPGSGEADIPSGPAARASDAAVTVFSCAYRAYDPAAGKTGGPGGVLATQRLALGDSYRGHQLVYLFQGPEKERLRDRLSVELAGLSGKVADILIAGEHIRTHPAILDALARDQRVLLVCHELGSAYGAHLLGVPYVLVYHQQGSTLQEMRSIGGQPSAHETNVVSRLERLICENANAVYFPSLGARDTYRATSEIGSDVLVDYADVALYNTVSAVDHVDGGDDRRARPDALRRELRLPVKDEHTDVFLSVGDFNADKGLDRVPALLERYTRLTGRRVVWIAVGAASDEARFAALQDRRAGWSFTARLVGDRMTHSRLLALMEYADYYVMMHRNAIFDLATLEAMRAGKALVLSPVGGNVEVDLDGNVLFVDESTLDDACRVLETRDRHEWGARNRRVFDEHFSLGEFARRYRAMLDEQLDAMEGTTR